MDKILLFLFLLFAGVNVNSQSGFIVDPVDVVEGTLSNADDEEVEVHWDVINASSEEVTFRARRIIGDEVSGSKNRFCWGPICYGDDTDESSTNESLLVVLPGGETESTFTGYYEHEGTAGCTQVTYCFFNHYSPTDEVCHLVTYAIDCTVGVDEVVNNEGELSNMSPNPVQGLASFSYQMNAVANDAKVIFYNMIGETVKEIPLNNPQGFIYIDGSDFSSGVYFYALVSNSEVLSTKKMIVNN